MMNASYDGSAEAPMAHQVFEQDILPGLGRRVGTVISSATSPSFYALDVLLDPQETVRPGALLAARATSDTNEVVYVVCRVDDILEHNPHKDAQGATLEQVLPFKTIYAEEGASTVIYRVCATETMEEAVPRDGGSIDIRAVQTLARAGAPVFTLSDDLAVMALGLQPDPSQGICVGEIYGSGAPVVLHRETIQRHIFIGGGIGSGKSYTRGVIGEELHYLGVPQINIDVNGEMIAQTRELGGVNLRPGRDFTLPLSALSASDVIQAIPAISDGTNIATLVRFTHEKLLKDVVDGSRDYFSIDDLVSEIDGCAEILNMTTAATLRPAKLRTQSLKRLQFLGAPFPWADKLSPGQLINIDCRGMGVTELRLIVASVMRDIQQLAKGRKIPFTVLSIDEFHLIAPNNEDTVTTQVLREIARIGRHYRLGLILTTQSPSDVDRSVLKRLLTRFLHAIEPDQLDALRGVFSDASEKLVKSMPKLPQGVCIVTGAAESIRHATVVKVRQRHTTHGGKTPDVFADLAERGWSGKHPAYDAGAGA
jgi:hypothetical protein